MKCFPRILRFARPFSFTTSAAAALRCCPRPVMEPLVVIYGSTGTGKSDLAVELATRFNGEIINADAMQMYEGLPIITNKLTSSEKRGIPHHLLGNIPLEDEPWSVTHFKREANRIVAEIRDRGKLPIVVGGTSYYLDGLLFDERLVEEHKDAAAGILPTRDELEAQYPILSGPAEAMLAKLREVDPAMANRWHPNDIRKIRNSLEIYFSTGRRASDIYAEQRVRKGAAQARSGSKRSNSWKTLLIWLYAKPEVLNERLETRVDKMVDKGLLDETAEVYTKLQSRLAAGEDVDRTKGIWQSIGLKQFEPYLRALEETPDDHSKLDALKQAGIEDTKTANRRYAKSQVRWITMKTLTSLQEEKVLDRLFLLDSSNIQLWKEEVLEKGVELTRQLLADEQLPQAVDLSETAREVLSSKVERSNRQEVACNQTCDLCKKTFLTEDLWQTHLKSKKHRKAVEWVKRTSLMVIDQAPGKEAAQEEPRVSQGEAQAAQGEQPQGIQEAESKPKPNEPL